MALQDGPHAGLSMAEQMDPKEKAEREEAADAYAKESPTHFVDYCNDCIDLSVKAMLDIRMLQEECWKVFNEEEPDNWNLKEIWMSRITYPGPNKTVRVGQAFARKAFDVDFLSIENEKDPEAEKLWVDIMGLMVSRNYANFPTKFSDAVAMALAIGTSMEIIPQWFPGEGLKLALINPENIHRDPAAESREPWSGRYWVHQEWMPYYYLKDGQDNGIYQNIADFSVGGNWTTSPDVSQEEQARRKNMVYTQGKFNQTVMVSEFWGTVLSPKGELLLPRAKYAIAGNQVIQPPTESPFPSQRWPGVGFSALPNLRRFDGQGLIQGIRSLWYFASNLLSLHSDNLNWIVNPMTEMNTDDMVDPRDNNIFPGKIQLVYRTQSGQSVVRTVERNTRNNDIIAMLSKAEMMMNSGSMVDQNIQGSPGWRSYVTKGEREINQGQSNDIMASVAADIEDGALNVIASMAETVMVNLTYDELKKWFPEHAEKYRDRSSPTGLNLPRLTTGTFKISGIAAFMKHQENLQNLAQMESLFESKIFNAYLKAYPYLKARIKYTNLVDLDLLVDQGRAAAIDQAQQGQQEAAIDHQAGTEAAAAAGAEGEAQKEQALAEEAQAQAGLFEAQAGAIPAGAEAGAPSGLETEIPGGMQ